MADPLKVSTGGEHLFDVAETATHDRGEEVDVHPGLHG